jgi:hypothetical protein
MNIQMNELHDIGIRDMSWELVKVILLEGHYLL